MQLRPSARLPPNKRAGPCNRHLLLPLLLVVAGTWSVFFCYFNGRQPGQQHLQQHHQLHVDDMSSSGPAAPIGLRLLRSSTPAPSDWPMVYKDFDHDLQCLRQGEGQVFFWHMRKAGGTNIRDVLCQVHDALPKGSFRLAVVEGPTMNASCFDERSRVFVTSLRDPIDRIISSYRYEGRFHRYDPRMYHTDAEVELAEQVAARQKNRRTLRNMPLGFREWVEQTRRNYYDRETPSYRKENVWVSVENYYIKSLVNRHRADPTQPVKRTDLELAKRILANMDVVLITEWLKEPKQTHYFTRRLGLDEATLGFDISFESQKNPRRYDRTWPDGELRSEDDHETLALLRSLNALDMELYEFAKALVGKRIDETPSTQPAVPESDEGPRHPCKGPPPRTAVTPERKGPLCLLPASEEEDLYFGKNSKYHQIGGP